MPHCPVTVVTVTRQEAWEAKIQGWGRYAALFSQLAILSYIPLHFG